VTNRARRSHRTSIGPTVTRQDLAQDLDAGLAAIGLDLPGSTRERLLDYLALLSRWNAVYNLTAIRDPAAMLVQHLLDCLAVVPILNACGPCEQVIDVGSGGGLPGVVLALVWPDARVLLVEPVGKKAAFLQQCIAELALTHTEVLAKSIESLETESGSGTRLIVCRAFAALPDYLRGIDRLVGPTTIVAAMKGMLPVDELAALPPGWRLDQAFALTVPGLNASRHLLLLSRIDASPADDPEPR
jgi:16S rRNA (guanine527-N7)-methyltransferase